MIEQFNKADITVRFFDGVLVNGTDHDRLAAAEGVTLGKFAKRLTLGELGCYFSHRRLWQAGGGFDVVRLGPLTPKMRRHRYADLGDGRTVYWTKSTAWGTGGYTITKDAARALLKSTKTFWGAVDADIDRVWTHWKKIQMVYPVAARPMDVPSIIGHRVEDRDRRIGFHERWWRRGTRHLYRFVVLLQRIKSRKQHRLSGFSKY